MLTTLVFQLYVKIKMSQKLYEYSIFAKTNDTAGDDAPCCVKWKKGGGGLRVKLNLLNWR